MESSSDVVSFRSESISSRVTQASKWVSGDQVGIFSSDQSVSGNLRYTVTPETNIFSPATDADKILTSAQPSVTYTSYYPYSTTLSNTSIYNVDVTDQSDLSKIDLLWAKCEVSGDKESVGFKFDHEMTKIKFDVAREDGSSMKECNFLGSINNVNTTAAFDVVSGVLSDVNAGKIPMTITFADDYKSASVEAIIVPTTDLSDVKFVFTLNDYDYNYRVEAIDGGWVSNKCYDYGDIVVDETSLGDKVLTTSTITNWVSGVSKEYGSTTTSKSPKANIGDYYYKDGTWSSVAEYSMKIAANPANYVVGIIYDVDHTGYSGYVISIVGNNTKLGWWYKSNGTKGSGYTAAYQWAEADYIAEATGGTDENNGLVNCAAVQAKYGNFDNFYQHKWCWELNNNPDLLYDASSPYNVWYMPSGNEMVAFCEMYSAQYNAATAAGVSYADFSVSFSDQFEDVVDPVAYPDQPEDLEAEFGAEYANRHKVLRQHTAADGQILYSTSTERSETQTLVWKLSAINGYTTQVLKKDNVGMCTRAILRFNSNTDAN